MRARQERTAAYYREAAGQIRALASNAGLPEVRREMFDLAERFERIADYVERRYPERGGAARRAPEEG